MFSFLIISIIINSLSDSDNSYVYHTVLYFATEGLLVYYFITRNCGEFNILSVVSLYAICCNHYHIIGNHVNVYKY